MNSRLLSAAAGVFALAALQSAAGAEMPTVRYALGDENSHSLSRLPFTIAQKKGFFAREGVQVKVVVSSLSNADAAEKGYVPALEKGGGADITTTSGAYFVQAVLNGSNTVAVSSQTNNPIYSLIVRPEVKSFADLKGKEIAMTSPWDTITMTTRKLLAIHGIGPNDFRYRHIHRSQGRWDCMKQGECGAVAIGQPADIEAVKQGYRRLGITNEAGPVIFDVEIVRRDWAASHKDALVRYIRAAADAMRFINDPNNNAEVAATIKQITGVPDDELREILANYRDPKLHILPKQAEIDMQQFNRLLSFIDESGVYGKKLPPAEHFVDLSYAKAAGIQ